ncbi:MAG: hypothetical protein K8S99_10995 [Planctomycetes bacterium]|nr:hypothetical protein [Planctomycetota bacterium]
MTDTNQNPPPDKTPSLDGESADQERTDGLSDSAALEALAEEGVPNPPPGEFAAAEFDDDDAAEEDHIPIAGFEDALPETPTATFTPSAGPRSTVVRKKKKDNTLKQTAIPLMATVGCLLLGVAFWSLLHLVGARKDTRDGANVMSWVMFLLGTPIGMILNGASVWFYLQIKRDAEEEAARKGTPIDGPPKA